jgi:hypothetical protein
MQINAQDLGATFIFDTDEEKLSISTSSFYLLLPAACSVSRAVQHPVTSSVDFQEKITLYALCISRNTGDFEH